ncbi:MAG: penicillin acylase family protein [Acidobacteriota bacterium]|nr:penicillin acylase family protein [Acidobacteriota bacterium]
MRRLLRFLIATLILFVLLVMAGGMYARARMRASLPMVSGETAMAGLDAPVRIDRDSLGVPTIVGDSREDVARALGFVHAQDRFFQMDLQRRQPAGELSALVGPRALAVDEESRRHRLREVARRAVEGTAPAYRAVLEAYAEGVNAGLQALGAAPPEYLVLRATPERWRPEDTILTVLAMFNTLQGRQAQFEQTIGAMRDALPEPLYRFLSAVGSEWDAPVDGGPLPRPPVPGPDVFDLRKTNARATPQRVNPNADEDAILGSNNWAVDGTHTASGAALVANDMHLSIGVPILWYRASMAFPDSRGAPHRVTGLTLPGLPSLVVGSNGHVAWGFTNTGGDWSDLVRIEPDPRDAGKYLTPDGPKPFDVFQETIAVKGGAAVTIAVRWTMWGPLVWADARGREYAQHWVAHDATLLSSDILAPERAHTVDELLAAIAGLGMPHQNVTMGDDTGRIAWTIGGAIPKRIGLDGVTPESWADGSRRWDGFLAAIDFPRIVDPPGGRIWTANAPVVDGERLALLGEGGYADGIRARLIRDRLQALGKATPIDMLSIQLEDKALYLERWRTLVLKLLARQTTGPRAEFKRLVEVTWTGRASRDSAAYRLVRQFRTVFVREVMTTLTAPAAAIDPAFDYSRSLRGEGPVWQLISERPAHLLAPRYPSWEDWMLAAVDEAIAALTADGARLADRTWGEANRAQFVHPLASGIPFFGRYLNMPGDPLPGDLYTPRAQSPRTGPSQRMVVSPGREHEGILHIPTGQSGHPLSPHYGDQYRAWLNGEASPFLPGPAVSTVMLTPLR